MINKYIAIFNITWEQELTYRLNFVLWRFRSVLQLLLVYFIWWTVFQNQTQVFNYTQAGILTYVLISAVIKAVVLSSRVVDVAGQIYEGNIVNFLLKPIGFINFYLIRDLSDKLLNILFVIFEVSALFFVLKPEFIVQSNNLIILEFLLACILGLILNFAMAFTIGLLAFWVENAWGPYFLLTIFLETLGGGLFPIDIMPRNIANLLMLTPFPYLIYFPAKVYLGTLSNIDLTKGFLILIFWVVALTLIMMFTLKQGLKTYTAIGH